MVRQNLMVQNYNQGISNDELIAQLNNDFLHTSEKDKIDMGDTLEKCEILSWSTI